MKSKYFTVEVNPTITSVANGQHAEFSDGDVLFDWTSFQIPRGSSKLIGVTAEIRPKGDSNNTVNKFPFELVFAKTKSLLAPSTLGNINSAPATSGSLQLQADRFLGTMPVVAGDFAAADQMAYASAAAPNGLVFEGEPNSGDTMGTDTLYVGGIAGGAFNFVSSCLINNGDLDGPIITVDGVDPRLFLIPGDTVVVTTTANTNVTKPMGVVRSLTGVSIILTEEFSTTDVVNNDFVYNASPIKLTLTFER